MSDESNDRYSIVQSLVLLILLGAVIEGGVILFIFITADEVDCNWLYCTATEVESISSTVVTSSSSHQVIIVSRPDIGSIGDRNMTFLVP